MLRVVEACDIGCGNTKNIYRFLTDFSFRYIGIKLTLAKEDFISWKLPPTILLIFMAILKIVLVSASEFFPRPHSSSQITMQCFRTLQYKKHICYIKTMIVFSFLLVSQQHEDQGDSIFLKSFGMLYIQTPVRHPSAVTEFVIWLQSIG